MAKWDRLVITVNEERNKEIRKIIRSEKTLIKLLENGLNNSMFFEKLEPNDEQVAIGALYRCIVCFSSMMVLLDNGYIGSVNALLRQCYEFLCWAKLAIDNDEKDVLNRLHESFYGESNGRADGLTSYFKKVEYITDSDEIDVSDIKSEGKDIFSNYSFYTHASRYTQQFPLASDDFYIEMEYCLAEVALWINVLYKVEESYLIKCLNQKDKNGEADDFLFGTFNYYNEKVLNQL